MERVRVRGMSDRVSAYVPDGGPRAVADMERQRRVVARQQALRNAWRMNKGPQLSLADKLAALRLIEETTK